MKQYWTIKKKKRITYIFTQYLAKIMYEIRWRHKHEKALVVGCLHSTHNANWILYIVFPNDVIKRVKIQNIISKSNTVMESALLLIIMEYCDYINTCVLLVKLVLFQFTSKFVKFWHLKLDLLPTSLNSNSNW